MRPKNLKTKIFLDSGNPADTREILKLTGFLDGQTTNPSLVAKHPEVQERLAKATAEQMNQFYREIVTEISGLIPHGSVSIEVYADETTEAASMFNQGKEYFSWISNAHIKYPTNTAGLEAAARSIAEGMRVNMTLVFSQAQAAAVHAATKGAKKGDVFLSPFIGRLDDIGINGMSFIANVIKMYREVDSHVEVLSASLRNDEHLQAVFALASDIATIPMKVLKQWAEAGLSVEQGYVYDNRDMKDLEYELHDLNADWKSFDLKHELTTNGITKFAADWNALIQ